ncbi:MAG: hypothetical protein AAB011_04685, partial [Candidatus Eisenbacteria bacterium]
MRITQLLLQQEALSAVRARLQSLQAAQAEVADGRRVRTLSDDPRVASEIMQLGSNLRETEQFRRNGLLATTRLTTEELVLESVHDVMSRAKGLAVTGAIPDPADPTRQAALGEAKMLLDQVISLGNTRVGEEYIFGGGETKVAPFKADGTYVGDTTLRRAEIDDGLTIVLNHSGDQILGKAIQELQDLVTELQSGTAASIGGAFGGLDAADQLTLAGQGIVGSRRRDVQETATRLGMRSGQMMD